MAPIVGPAASHHQSSRRRNAELTAGHTPRRRRPKQAPPTLVIMPDGYSLCFAVRESPASSTAAISSPVEYTASTNISGNTAAEGPLQDGASSASQPQSEITPPSIAVTHAEAPRPEPPLPGATPAGLSWS